MSKFAKNILKGFGLSFVIFLSFMIGFKVGVKTMTPRIIHLERENKMQEDILKEREEDKTQEEQKNIIEEGGTPHYDGDINYNLSE